MIDKNYLLSKFRGGGGHDNVRQVGKGEQILDTKD